MNRFKFWQKWLLVVSLSIVILGLFIALFNFTLIFNYVFHRQINPIFWKEKILLKSTIEFQSWIYGVLGATVSGWGVIMLFIAKYPFKKKQKWSWLAIASSTGVWFIVDTSISIYFNVYFNALFNTILFLVICLPLLFTIKYFFSEKKIKPSI